jgi:hypothetical protein
MNETEGVKGVEVDGADYNREPPLSGREAQLELMVQRLTTRIKTKDDEFSKERARWKSEIRKLKDTVKALRAGRSAA